MNRKSFNAVECSNEKCRARIHPPNSATNFVNPALSVKLAVERGLIPTSSTLLEIGSGNLRNALYPMKSIDDLAVTVYDLPATVERFSSRYAKLRRAGGTLTANPFSSRKYDFIVCTFVLETVCPESKRESILRSIKASLKARGALIASFRGFKGVRGSQYKPCPEKQGLITPLNTFIKPYSLPDVKRLLNCCGFDSISYLQRYQVDEPENIHLLAS
jgi:hypothetical protein